MIFSTKYKQFPGKEMGLLKRAMYFNGFPVKGIGLLNRMLWLKKQGKSKKINPLESNRAILSFNTLGLLKKSIQMADKNREIIVLYTPPLITKELSQNIFNSIEKIPGNLEFPCHLFSLLKEQLNFSKSALYLSSHYKQEFLPWTQSGLALNELKYLTLGPKSAVIQLIQNKSYEIIEQAHLFQGLDSQKISPLILIPFIYNNNIIAILAVFQIAIHADGIQIFLNFLADFTQKTAKTIYHKRQFQLNSLMKNDYGKYNNTSQAARILYKECEDLEISLYLLDISLGTLLEKVKQRNKYIDVYRFQDDMLLFLNSLLAHLGTVFSQKENELLFMVKGYKTLNPEILLHQTYLSLHNFFKEISQNWCFDFTYKLKTFPVNGMSLEELIKEL